MPRLGLTFALLVLAAAFLAAPANAAFAPAGDPVASGESLNANGLAMDAEGNSIATWDDKPSSEAVREVRARRVAADGTLAPVIDLAPGEIASQPSVAMTPDGRAFAAWRWEPVEFGPDGVKGRWIEPDGTLGPLLTLIEPTEKVDAVEVMVVIDPTGVATVGWRNQKESELELRRAQPDSSMGPLVSDVSEGGVSDPRIAALPNGSTVAVWRDSGIEKNVVSAGGVAGTVETISVSSGIEATPGLGVDSLGDGYAVWRLHESGPPQTFSVRGRRLDSSGAAVGGELTIDPPGEPGILVDVGVSADTAGDFLVHWSRRPTIEENDYIANMRPLNASGEFLGPATPVSVLPGSVTRIRAAVMDTGTVATVWQSSQELASETLGRELGFPSLTGGSIQPLLEAGGENLAASAPAVGAAAFLTDYFVAASSEHVLSLRRFLLPPTCANSTVKMTRRVAASVPISCDGAGIDGAEVISKPRHGKLGAFNPATGAFAYTPKSNSPRNDSFTYRALNDGGSSSTVTVKLKDKLRPRVTGLRLLRSKRTKKRARLFRIRVAFSEPTRPRIVVQRRLPGIVKGKRCVKPKSRAELKTKVRCARFHKIGVVKRKGLSRNWKIRPPRKIQNKFRKGGGFRIVARGTDRAGNKSPVKRVKAKT